LLYGAAWLKKPFELPLLRGIGVISFSLYMWHYPFLWLFPDGVVNPAMGWQGWGNSFKIAILLVWISFVIFPLALTFYRWIEMPGIRLGEMLLQKIEQSKRKRTIDISKDIAVKDAITMRKSGNFVTID
jgi:peptidoglycan/LPS O-acetylase OafA/YrhL